MIEVKLNRWELSRAAMTGIFWAIESLFAGHTPRVPFKSGEFWTGNIEGACGETAYCKAINVYWPGHVNVFTQKADVGKDWEVRTRSSHDYDLLVRPRDSDNKRYILVTGSAYPKPIYRVWGWLWGHEAKQEKYKEDYGGRGAAYFVPSGELTPIERPYEEDDFAQLMLNPR